jgi:adenylate kinase
MNSTSKIKTVLLFGPPGSGKGTQGKILGTIPGYVHVACGDIFRDLKIGSRLGHVFIEYSSRGELVPDEVTVELWREYVDGLVRQQRLAPDTDVLVLDGIPRTVAQAQLMENHVEVVRLYNLVCTNRERLYLRLKRRALRENRLDDASDAVIEHRQEVYEHETAPVLEYYPAAIRQTINTDVSPVEILADILADLRTAQVFKSTV